MHIHAHVHPPIRINQLPLGQSANELHLHQQRTEVVLFLLKYLCVWSRSAGQKRGKGGEEADGGEEIPAEEGRMDGWLDRTPTRGRREGGREENWVEVKEAR